MKTIEQRKQMLAESGASHITIAISHAGLDGGERVLVPISIVRDCACDGCNGAIAVMLEAFHRHMGEEGHVNLLEEGA